MKPSPSAGVVLVPSARDPKLDRFSASQTTTYLDCPAKWFHSRQRPWAGSAPASLGTETHARLEAWQRDQPLPPLDVPATDKRDAQPFLTPELVARADLMAREARVAFPGPADGVHPEFEFVVDVVVDGRVRCQLSGLIDTLDQRSATPEVIDLKTTSDFGRALDEESLASDPQALIYAGVALGRLPEADAVSCRWVYVHSKNKRKMLGPQPTVTLSRAAIGLGLRALWLGAWEPMIRASGKKRPPPGNAPSACTRYRWGCDFCASSGGPCEEFVKLGPAIRLDL